MPVNTHNPRRFLLHLKEFEKIIIKTLDKQAALCKIIEKIIIKKTSNTKKTEKRRLKMKKTAKILSLCLAAAMLMCSLAACGSSSSDTGSAESTLEGNTYVFTSYTVDGEDQSEVMTAMYAEMSLTFEADGVCVQSITWSEEYAELLGISDPVEQEGTYEESGETVTVTFESDEGDTVMELTVDGDTLSMDEDGCITTYTLQ